MGATPNIERELLTSTANMPPSQENVTQLPYPSLVFYGSARTNTALLYSVICVVSLALHTVFIYGVRNLCGWRSNFCFTLLLVVSLMCVIRYATELIASLTSLFYLDWIKYQDLWAGFGAFAFAPYFTIMILNIALTVHRLAYTAFPLTASSYLNKFVLQGTLLTIFLFFMSILLAMNIGLLGIRWVDAHMTWAIMKSRNPAVVRLFNSLSNYCIGILNPCAYTLLFLLLWQRRLISFKRNHEIRMTLQVVCMAVCELFFFLYWEFSQVELDGFWSSIVDETTNLLYFDVLVVPYLILNENIRSQIKALKRTNCVHVTRSGISRTNVFIH
ncbi:hypothetical protein Y032_0328g2647 [Ancylostoma ceylanicum]|uniref:Serpentine receptor class gamma n=1 Tax=Ancylostoma ceylanicum TaxID=53326 RepID=A0A016S0R0_9BILA|nr:hypothetical protein Y032_0328g2647 [Ancylostoma ceylanicum]